MTLCKANQELIEELEKLKQGAFKEGKLQEHYIYFKMIICYEKSAENEQKAFLSELNMIDTAPEPAVRLWFKEKIQELSGGMT